MDIEQQRLGKIQDVWNARITAEEETHGDYRDHALNVHKILNAEQSDLFVPLYWSVVGVEKNGVYSAQPVPDVRPFDDNAPPVMKQVARVISRALTYVVDQQSFDLNYSRSVRDYLGMGLGVCRVKIDSVIVTDTTSIPIMGTDPMGMPMEVGMREQVEESVGDQTLRWEYVPFNQFGWEPCNSWEHCSWIYFRHRMTQTEIRKRFGRTVKASKDKTGSKSKWKANTFDIYEIWDKEKRKVLFIAKGEPFPLEVIDDPLGLIGFWPCPPPMMTNLPSDELIPKPDYDFIKEYDREINRLQERRASLMESIKASGAYDSGMPELADMLELSDGEYQPVQNMLQRMAAAGGAEGMIYHLPMAEKVQTLIQITEQIAFVKAQVDEILGISDIIRGVTKASESATAQEIKGRWVGVRLTDKREAVQYTVREMFRISSEVLATMITPENLQRMTQMPITEEMMQILSDDTLMSFSIDIETDSTVAKDEFKERETRQEMLNGIAQFAQSVLPMVQNNMMPADTASAILRAALRPYAQMDRSLEESLANLPTSQQQLTQLSQTLQQTQQQLQQAQQQAQQWQQIAQQLQMRSTEATSQQRTADAQKKMAEAQKILQDSNADLSTIRAARQAAEVESIRTNTEKTRAGISAEQLKAQQTLADIRNTNADTIDKLRPNGQG